MEGTEEENEIIEEIDKLRHYIRLQLNPDPEAELERKIEDLISRIPKLTHKTKVQELKDALNELIEVSQILLKAEWDKVREESKRGDLNENEHCMGPVLRKMNNWCLHITKRWTKNA